jgi:peptidoglycan/LPS O-acetylase OafA/YrhL
MTNLEFEISKRRNINMTYNNFTFLRFLAASFVVFSHSHKILGINREPIKTILGCDFGTFGVSIFFIISGYLITQSWIKNPDAINFLRNRFLRIFPALFCCLIITTLFLGPALTSLNFSEYINSPQTYAYLFKGFIFQFEFHLPGLFKNNLHETRVNGSLWTLPTEVFCYFGVLIFGFSKLINKRLFVLIFTLALILLFFLVINNPFALKYQSLLPQILSDKYTFANGIYFLCGSLFFLYKDAIFFKKHLLFSMTFLYLVSANTIFYKLVSFGTLPYIVLYFALATKVKILKDFGKTTDLSYGIYIYSYPIQQTIFYLANNKISLSNFFITSYLTSILFGFLSFYLIEKKFLTLKKKSVVDNKTNQ